MLSGALLAGCLTTAEWFRGGSLPVAVRPAKGGPHAASLQFVQLAPTQYGVFLARYVVHDALGGAILGLFGGVISALVSLYWRRAGGLIGLTIVWSIIGITLPACGWLMSLALDFAENRRSSYPDIMIPLLQMLAASGTIGAGFGAFLGFFSRLLPALHGAGRTTREPPRPLLPAWLRLLLYVPCATALLLLGLIAASVLLIDPYAVPGAEDPTTALMTPWADTLLVYGQFLLVVPFTLWFARRYDCRSRGEIGLAVTPTMARDLLLGAALGAAADAVWITGFVALGLVAIHRTDDPVAQAFLWGLPICAAIGISEEVIFRGYVLANLDRALGRAGAIWLSAILFWAYHLAIPYAAEPLNALGYILWGVLFALCYLATGSLWLPISLHAAYDFMCLSVFNAAPPWCLPAVFYREFHAPLWLTGDSQRTGLAGISLLLLLLAAVYLWLYRPARLGEKARQPGIDFG
jgi:membrane protease YdiL (CAAX protease family)